MQFNQCTYLFAQSVRRTQASQRPLGQIPADVRVTLEVSHAVRINGVGVRLTAGTYLFAQSVRRTQASQRPLGQIPADVRVTLEVSHAVRINGVGVRLTAVVQQHDPAQNRVGWDGLDCADGMFPYIRCRAAA